MAASSLGKLDAICARLKSCQQPLLSAGSSAETRKRSQDAKEEAGVPAHSNGISEVIGKYQEQKDVKPYSQLPTGASVKDMYLPSTFPGTPEDGGQVCTKILGKVKVKSESLVAVESKVEDGSVIGKYNSNNNNNNTAKAADCNNEMCFTAHSTVFHIADSTSTVLNADSVVSSTTAEPNLCNENILTRQAEVIPINLSSLLPHSCSVSLGSETGSAFMACTPSPAAAATTTFSSSALISQYVSMFPKTPVSKSIRNQTIDIHDYGYTLPSNSESYNEPEKMHSQSSDNHLHDIDITNVQNDVKNTYGPFNILENSSNSAASQDVDPIIIRHTQAVQGRSSIDGALHLSPSSSPFTVSSDPYLFSTSPHSSALNPANFAGKKRKSISSSDRKASCSSSFKAHIVSEYSSADGGTDMGQDYPNLLQSSDISRHPVTHKLTGKCCLPSDKCIITGTNAEQDVTNVKLEPPVQRQSSQNAASKACAESSGRRKSRKPAKPQRQVSGMHFNEHGIDHYFGNPDCANPPVEQTNDVNPCSGSDVKFEEMRSPRNSENHVSTHCITFPPTVAAPVDLSMGNPSSHSFELPFTSGLPESTPGIPYHIVKSEDGDSKLITLRPTIKSAIPEATDGKKPSNNHMASGFKTPMSTSPVSETADSKVLVDFANNTMKELLGIYGFEGSEAKSASLNSLQNFQPDKLTQFSGADNKPSSGVQVKEEEEVSPAKISKNKLTKGNIFRRYNVPSGAAHSVCISPVSDDQEQECNASASRQDGKPAEAVAVKHAAKSSKYSFSKKSYTQKVLTSADFSKYIKRFDTGTGCGGKVCQDLGYRDHYHCLDCHQKVFIRKEEMVRHYKWHKKRNDSLQHGFMRYSPTDDCSKKYGNCMHNGRQTHYHCVQMDCGKVYISTSDVQMHANFHRKDSAIIQEGFQRFRATEDCGTISCLFYGQRTTHFHCRRTHCNFTFKNKADMEKHKSYHQKDEVLSRDGFKKFMKYEACPYSGCRYSKISNHIHCIRQGCQYVLHSTAQLYSHKRKHERREFEYAYRSFRHSQQHVPAVKLEASVKEEPLDKVTSFPTSPATSSLTKILPLPASAISATHLNPGATVQAASIDVVQEQPAGSSTTTALLINSTTTTKSFPGQSFAITTPLVLPKRATLPESIITKKASELSGVLNLSGKRIDKTNNAEDLRQTLTLPVKFLPETISPSTVIALKLESKLEVVENEEERSVQDYFSDEPEDLSMHTKKKEGYSFKEEKGYTANVKEKTTNDTYFSAEQKSGNTSFQSEIDSSNIQDFSETLDEDDNDDDDDDDDDKDYGIVEEPTLVNTFIAGPEIDKLNDSLDLTVPKQDREFDKAQVKKERSPCDSDAVELSAGTSRSLFKAVSSDQQSVEGIILHEEPHDQQPLLPQPLHGTPQAILTPKGKVLGVHIPVRLLPERRERDEAWRKYLIRFTANDACFSRCACLYKDHYHCRIKGCQVVFKSKDGVRGHARFHELQDSITPIVYLHYKSDASCCSKDCQYSGQEEHFHCNWENCTHVISSSAPTFSKLEHYRIHEYATASLSKGRSSFTLAGSKTELDPLHKRRGRPPKFPKYDLPFVPKVHLTEKEILESALAFMHNKSSENSKIINGFKKFVTSELCPDEQCIYRGKDHFHCGRKFCHMSTDRLDVLNLHAKDFHNNVTILNGYEFFERMVNCRRPSCHNNKVNRHFHCIRPRCDYSFVRHSTMSQHNKKHPTVTSAVLSAAQGVKTTPPQIKVTAPQYVPIAPAVTTSAPATPTPPTPTPPTPTTTAASPGVTKTVKSSGTYFPLSGLSSFKLSSLPSVSVSSSQIMTTGSRGQVLTCNTLATNNTNQARIIPGAQIFQTQDGTTIFPTGTLLTLPHNLITTSIPVLAQSAQGQPAGMLTGIIPVGQLSQHGLATPLVSIAGGQIITAPLQHNGGILGTGVVQVVQPPTSISSHPTTALASVSSISGSHVTTLPAAAQPFTVLLPQHQQGSSPAPVNWASLKKQMHYSVDLNCGRPFCKLKKKDHYHCLDCNQAFSDPTRLRAHISKHGFKFKKSESGAKQNSKLQSDSALAPKPVDLSLDTKSKSSKVELNETANDNEDLSSSLNLQASVFTSMVKHSDSSDIPVDSAAYMNGNTKKSPNKHSSNMCTSASNAGSSWKTALEAEDDNDEGGDVSLSKISNSSDSKNEKCLDSLSVVINDGLDGSDESSLDASSSSLTLCLSLSRKPNRKRMATKSSNHVLKDVDALPKPAKQRRMHWGSRSETDLPEGYKRVRCGEDCGHVRCAYRQTVTHFHCVRIDCGYGFSDKSRIIQHRIRHERLDALMGGEFQQYRASVTCERADCEFDEKASHFHCLKCPYSCADSSKVPAHRKYHSKLDNISNNGFTKYTGTSDCQIATCSYFRKQTHYHCTFPGCGHAVLGPSQMAPHKLKHAQHQSV